MYLECYLKYFHTSYINSSLIYIAHEVHELIVSFSNVSNNNNVKSTKNANDNRYRSLIHTFTIVNKSMLADNVSCHADIKTYSITTFATFENEI